MRFELFGSLMLLGFCAIFMRLRIFPLIAGCASAILIEAGLSFLGAGTPPEIPTWGNMIASSRVYLARAPWTVFCPGVALALVVLAVNLVGDGLRDRLDPRIARRM